jgi:hypothetical protein
MKPKVVVLDDPFTVDVANTVMAHDFRLRYPFASEMIEQRGFDRRMLGEDRAANT